MEYIGILVLVGLVTWTVLAVKSAKKNKDACSGCTGNCAHCAAKNEKPPD